MKYQAIVLGAGVGNRTKLSYNKVFYKIENKTIIEKSVAVFLNDDNCEKVIIVYNSLDINRILGLFNNNKICLVVGGKTRQESVLNGLKEVTSEYVLIHDAARPYLTSDLINRILDALKTHEAVIPVIDIFDTVKIVKDNYVAKTIKRDNLKLVQTPQGFKSTTIIEAFRLAKNNKHTDDAALIEKVLHKKVYTVKGEYSNQKITIKEDL